jgi:hypothetical protein
MLMRYRQRNCGIDESETEPSSDGTMSVDKSEVYACDTVTATAQGADPATIR